MNPLFARIIPMLPMLLKKKRSWAGLAVVAALVYLFTGDTGASLSAFWKEPRDLLVDRVEDARDAQQDAAEQFRDALTEFKAVVDVGESDLEKRYKTLNAVYERSADAAADIEKRVERVVGASNRLLDEWREELGQYNDANLRRQAEAQFDQTRTQATRLIESMRASEASMQPVLNAFRDQVLYLKHNLNLSAIASLEGEAQTIETDVDALIAEMERAIAEADAFINIMKDRA